MADINKFVKLINFEKEEVSSLGYEISYGINLINAPYMWNEGYTEKNVVIAVIDTGCDKGHPDLKNKIIEGRNFTTDNGGNPDIYMDYNGHSTHVAGIIAAINYAISKKVDIISMSLGGPDDVTELHNAIINAVNNNILVVCAAGNGGDNSDLTDELDYLGTYEEVIEVGVIDMNKAPAYFTNSNEVVDILAPGVSILSTYKDQSYAILSGTSMAAPYISGSLALIIEWSTKEFGRRLSES